MTPHRRSRVLTGARSTESGLAQSLMVGAMAELRDAEIVVVGGGAIGCAVAYRLAEAGKRDVLLVEKEAALAERDHGAGGGPGRPGAELGRPGPARDGLGRDLPRAAGGARAAAGLARGRQPPDRARGRARPRVRAPDPDLPRGRACGRAARSRRRPGALAGPGDGARQGDPLVRKRRLSPALRPRDGLPGSRPRARRALRDRRAGHRDHPPGRRRRRRRDRSGPDPLPDRDRRRRRARLSRRPHGRPGIADRAGAPPVLHHRADRRHPARLALPAGARRHALRAPGRQRAAARRLGARRRSRPIRAAIP